MDTKKRKLHVIIVSILSMFVIVNLFLLYLVIFHYTFGELILLIIGLLVMLYLTLVCFSIYTKEFPHNKLEEYNINVRVTSFFAKSDNGLQIHFINESGIWKSIDCNKSIILYLHKYPFPKKYIQSYLIRQFKMLAYNQSKKPLYHFFSRSYKHSDIYTHDTVQVFFHESNKVSMKYIIRNKALHNDPIIEWINNSPYWRYVYVPHSAADMDQHVEMTELKYKFGRIS